MSEAQAEDEKAPNPHTGLVIGIALGTAFGAALGSVGLGLALGIALGVAYDQKAGAANVKPEDEAGE